MARWNQDSYEPDAPNSGTVTLTSPSPSTDSGGGVSTNPGKPVAVDPNPPPQTNPIPTNANGSQVGSGTPWAAGASQPSSAPAGYQWDANMAMFRPTSGGGGSSQPTYGGNSFDPNYISQAIQYWSTLPGANPSLKNDPNFWQNAITGYGRPGLSPDNFSYWQNLAMRPEGAPENWTPSMGSNPQNWSFSGGGNNYNGTSVFGDPATQQYEQLLNQMISRLNQPYTPSSFEPAMNYLNQYFQQLQGPAYTPEQTDLLNTQLFDPLMRQRDQEEQAIIQRFARQGMGPDSGPVQQAILQNRQRYEQMGTQARAGVASNAIGLQKQQQGQAAQLGPLMASLQQQLQNSNEQRMLQGTSLASVIPAMAWSRLTGAQNGIQPLANPADLLRQQQTAQNTGYTQGSNYMSQLMQALFSIFGG
jgi:hypothetical protein